VAVIKCRLLMSNRHLITATLLFPVVAFTQRAKHPGECWLWAMQPLNFLLQSATNPSPAFVISAEPETTGSDFHQYEKQYKEETDW